MTWINKDLKCVVLCAGKGERISPISNETQKVMIKLGGKPIIHYVIDYWKKYSNNFIFVIGYKKQQVIEYVKKLPINSEFVEQKELKGIGNAVSYVEDFIKDKLIVVLGDCIFRGEFNFPQNMKQGIGVYKTNNENYIKQNYLVKIKNELVYEVKEKPKKVVNNYCGMGFYFFDKRVFNYIKMTNPSKLRNEIEITDVIQNMINSREEINPVFFNGNYLNITSPEDIEKAYFIQ